MILLYTKKTKFACHSVAEDSETEATEAEAASIDDIREKRKWQNPLHVGDYDV
jgi:hypothetical protein